MLHAVFNALFEQRVALEGMLLKPNMVISGKECAKQASVEEVARATLRCLRRHAPAAVPGNRLPVRRAGSPRRHHASERDQSARGTEALEAQFFIRARAAGRGASSLAGQGRKPQSGQQAFAHRAKCVSAAALGKYTAAMESESGGMRQDGASR